MDSGVGVYLNVQVRMLKTDCFLHLNGMFSFASILFKLQPSVPVPVKMEGPAQLLTLAPVMWGGLECSVKQVHTVQNRDWHLWMYLDHCHNNHQSSLLFVIVSSPAIDC